MHVLIKDWHANQCVCVNHYRLPRRVLNLDPFSSANMPRGSSFYMLIKLMSACIHAPSVANAQACTLSDGLGDGANMTTDLSNG